MIRNSFFKKTFLLILSVIFGLFIHKYNTFAANAQLHIELTPPLSCGNSIKEEGEQCDGADLDGQTCVSRGFTGGTLSCNANCTFNTNSCTSGDGGVARGGGGGGVLPPETKVILQGKAYPSSRVTILKDGKVTATIIADAQANFNLGISDITAGIWTFGVWAEDKEGRKSLTFSFTTNIISGVTTTISGIFLPPTIDLSETFLQRGETLNILGQSAPKSEISIIVNSPKIITKKTIAENDGTWFYSFDTTPLEDGSHLSWAKAISPEGLSSTFSQALSFNIGKEITGLIKESDMNDDNKVNLIDFSILLYNWGIPKNPNADLNGDGKVDLVDFSIMLYRWTG